jgi:hypothetical protein
VAALGAPLSLWADWINLTGAETAANIAEFTVTDGAVDVALEVYPRDQQLFLRPDGFALEIRADGVALTPEVLLQEPRERKDRFSPYAGMVDPRTRRLIPGPPADSGVIYLELRYPFEGQPGQLLFTPPLDEAGVASASIGFLLYHKAAPVVDFRYLSQPEALNLDWDDPWYTSFENRNLVRHHRWPQMTFLYLEPRELRHESLVRVRDLMEWTQDSPDVQRQLSEAEQVQLKEAAGEFFLERNPVLIEGRPVRRSTYRAEFLGITPQGLRALDPGAPVDASAALLGISESYWVEVLPQSASMEWQLFDERVERVPTNVIDPAGPYPGFIDANDPVLSWKNFITDWREPSVQPLTASAGSWFDTTWLRMAFFGTPDEETAARVVGELLRRTAIAFLERDPERLTLALAKLVADPASPGVQTELQRVFAVPTTGGGVAGITALGDPRLEELSPAASGEGFSVLANWQAQVKGQHWGHVDQRIIRFRVLIDIGDVGGYWKLLDLTVLEAQTPGA